MPPVSQSFILLLCVARPADDQGNHLSHYLSFVTGDLYSWRTQHSPFSDNLRDLINPLETVLFTHQSTWDDCQQRFQVFLTAEERERIQNEASRLIHGPTGEPISNQETLDTCFCLTSPYWDYNTRR